MEVLSGIVAYSETYNWSFHPDFEEWELPGQGDPYPTCGSFGYRGCLDHGEVEKFRCTCNRLSCPICYESAARLSARKIAWRLKQKRDRWNAPVHLSVDPSPSLWMLSKKELTALAYKELKRRGIIGGVAIFHSKRQKKDKSWFVSPHFHALGYGWLKDNFLPGWVVKNHGVRMSDREIYTTLKYQLSHAGVHAIKETVTWFGSCYCGKKGSKMIPFPKEKHLCPVCKKELRTLLWVGAGKDPPPLDHYKFKASDWVYAPSWRGNFFHDEREARAPLLIDYRFCIVKPSKVVSKPQVEHTYEALKEANPEMPDWMIKLFLGE